MNKRIIWCFLLIFGGVSALPGADYYFHSTFGSDTHPGTSVQRPFRTLDKIASLTLMAGDRILLAAGESFEGMLKLEAVQGTAEKPIIITTYYWGNNQFQAPAKIDAGNAPHGIHLLNCSHICVSNLAITGNGGTSDENMRCGVLVNTSKAGLYQNITLDQLDISDIFIESPGYARGKDEVRTANGTQRYGWGIRFINLTPHALIKQVVVKNCRIRDVAHTGIKFTSRVEPTHDIEVFNNVVERTGGPGIQMSGARFGHIHNNRVQYSGSPDDSRKWGRGSGLWTWGSSYILIENNRFLNANGPGDSAGCHIDFNCSNVIVQYNFSANNAGGFCEILGNNYNCAYRYNISVNDGHRVKGENGAFQEGKIFWLSGYNGNKNKRKGPFNSYFYNNTIYVKSGQVAKVAIDRAADGFLIANNIFYFEGGSQLVKGDQYQPEAEGGWAGKNDLFSHNLFLKADHWPETHPIQDQHPIVGNPGFLQAGGTRLIDYLPANKTLVQDAGLPIPYIPNDTIGLYLGLPVQRDILGNPINGKPDLGAIEVEE